MSDLRCITMNEEGKAAVRRLTADMNRLNDQATVAFAKLAAGLRELMIAFQERERP